MLQSNCINTIIFISMKVLVLIFCLFYGIINQDNLRSENVMKKLLAGMLINLSGLIIVMTGILVSIVANASQEFMGTILIVIGAVIWLTGLILFIITKEKNN